MNTVNKPFRKKDAMQLVTGQPVYMDDLVPADCLIVKLLRSPHANAIVKSINTAVAEKVPGIEPSSPGRTCRRMPAATLRPARLTPRPAPMTAFSSTATSALWATWWPSWQAKTINASIRR